MASLLDIGPLTEDVEIHGVKLTVQGLSAGHLFQLFNDFPDMRKLLDNKNGDPKEIFLSLAPELIAKIIAMVTGSPHDKQAEMQAMALGAGDQLAIMLAMQRLSFPNGIGPFVDGVTKLMTSTSEMSVALPKTGSPNPSASSTTSSPAPFNASLQMDTPGMLHGRARRAN
jgi:hypothetical protein